MKKKRNSRWIGTTCCLAAAGIAAISLTLTALSNVDHNMQAEFMIATDLHYLSPKLTDHGSFFTSLIENADGKTMAYSEEVTEAFVDTVIEKKPEALILTGDLTFNGAKKSHKDLAKKLKRVTKAGIQVLVLSGNHDLNSTVGASFKGDGYQPVEGVTREEFEEIYKDFGFDGACSRDNASSSYVWEMKPGLKLLMLDVNGGGKQGTVSDETLSWLEEQLKKAKKEHAKVLSFSHQNLLAHSMYTNGYVISNSERVLNLYEKYQVSVHFSGHLHIQHIEEQERFTEIATSALSVAPTQYGKVIITGNSLKYSTNSVDVSHWAADKGITDENLLHFDTYAENYLADNSYRQARAALKDMEDDEMAETMARYHAVQNTGYYAGVQAKGQKALLEAWKNSGTFLGIYLSSFCDKAWENQNHKVILL
ncbi:MAG: metallophosphoesterase [Hungatella sp.]|nr:metallophosphoesterase [Hungatella sp.]